MLDLNWERSLPVVQLKSKEIKLLFNEFDRQLEIMDAKIIELGCRTSNYIVQTNKGKFLLRIALPYEVNNERSSYELLEGKINIPQLIYSTVKEDYNIYIYQFIDGIPLQKIIVDTNRCDRMLLKQVAQSAAIIHNIKEENISHLAELEVPPFQTWYSFFLENTVLIDRIGRDRYKRLKELIAGKQDEISEIDTYYSFTHSDFRAANMLVDERDSVFTVDWECACLGHSLADVGQFFRYRRCFSDSDMKLFKFTYNEYADRKLPVNWEELSLLRDLVNPLQMLNSTQELPMKYADLIHILDQTLAFWN